MPHRCEQYRRAGPRPTFTNGRPQLLAWTLACCPLLGAQRLGDPARGALLISAIAVASLTANAILARPPAPQAPGSTAPVRTRLAGHLGARETPANLRGQVYTTAASLKIAGLAAGAAPAGPLAGWSVTECLLIAAGTELICPELSGQRICG